MIDVRLGQIVVDCWFSLSRYKALGGGWPTTQEIKKAGSFIEAFLPAD